MEGSRQTPKDCFPSIVWGEKSFLWLPASSLPHHHSQEHFQLSKTPLVRTWSLNKSPCAFCREPDSGQWVSLRKAVYSQSCVGPQIDVLQGREVCVSVALFLCWDSQYLEPGKSIKILKYSRSKALRRVNCFLKCYKEHSRLKSSDQRNAWRPVNMRIPQRAGIIGTSRAS